MLVVSHGALVVLSRDRFEGEQTLGATTRTRGILRFGAARRQLCIGLGDVRLGHSRFGTLHCYKRLARGHAVAGADRHSQNSTARRRPEARGAVFVWRDFAGYDSAAGRGSHGDDAPLYASMLNLRGTEDDCFASGL